MVIAKILELANYIMLKFIVVVALTTATLMRPGKESGVRCGGGS